MASPIGPEALSGTIDGVNTVFTFSSPYSAGTSAIYLNGQLLTSASGNPWSESDPSTGEITITDSACIPRVGDEISGLAFDLDADAEAIEITEIAGSLSLLTGVQGSLEEVSELSSSLGENEPVAAQLEQTIDLAGETRTIVSIAGQIAVCD